MLKIIFYLGTSLTANLDARPRRMPGIPGLALGRNSPALLSSPRMPRGTGDFDEFHSVCFWVERLVFPHEITRDYRFLSLAHLSLSLAHAASVPAAYGRLLMTGITMSGSSYYRSSLFASFSAAFFFFAIAITQISETRGGRAVNIYSRSLARSTLRIARVGGVGDDLIL